VTTSDACGFRRCFHMHLRNTARCQFKVVFDAIRELMTPPEPKPRRRIGFVPDQET